eukprot:CAMPEP_0114280914 /NCGR_PEP_ID=MMETSP0059-20121206/2699_1 /TAXON_ID=36894 /ORGANISM="Pyramimonas parkeae, Strain CCMP726" /LENGTH=66 /DNA_ID=CAMNT_0001401361 /DNA_START=549 /DNA_END=746 /DNA_ORIENTATION=-
MRAAQLGGTRRGARAASVLAPPAPVVRAAILGASLGGLVASMHLAPLAPAVRHAQALAVCGERPAT